MAVFKAPRVPHTQRVDLKTSLKVLENLTRIADGKARMVRIERQALLNLIIDHGNLAAAAEKVVRLMEPSTRVRLRK